MGSRESEWGAERVTGSKLGTNGVRVGLRRSSLQCRMNVNDSGPWERHPDEHPTCSYMSDQGQHENG